MTEILLTGPKIGESARWHDGRLWLANWGTPDVLAVDLAGTTEVMARLTPKAPNSFDWLPDGQLLLVSGAEGRLLRQEPEGTLVDHADLSGFGGLNEIVVDDRGYVYVNGGSDFHPKGTEPPGFIVLVKPDGSVRKVADGLAFPNGMAITPDGATLIVAESFASTLTAFDIEPDGGLSNRRVWAPVMADGIVMDAEGAVWTPSWTPDGKPACLRVAEGGEILQTVLLDRAGFACTLGGEDGRTLFVLAADWHPGEGFEENLERLFTGPETGIVVTTRAPAPHAGHP